MNELIKIVSVLRTSNYSGIQRIISKALIEYACLSPTEVLTWMKLLNYRRTFEFQLKVTFEVQRREKAQRMKEFKIADFGFRRRKELKWKLY